MTKTKNGNKINKLSDFLPMHIIHEFSNYTYEERKTKLKEAHDFLKRRNIKIHHKPAFGN
jgi:thioredoxin-related protein